ncbi:MAG: hypothetical protein Q7K26_01855 [bacterium]|nr:hypothetical protein [bacterium]
MSIYYKPRDFIITYHHDHYQDLSDVWMPKASLVNRHTWERAIVCCPDPERSREMADCAVRREAAKRIREDNWRN